MSGYWQCALVCEGRSDEPLAEALQSLMLACRPGDDIAVEVYRPERATDRSVAAKLAVIAADDVYDLVFVHRDADNAGWEARAEEIRSAGEKRAVPVIPVRMTETWALAHLWADEECRKWLADNASIGRLRTLEEMSDPKEMLRRWASRGRTSLLAGDDWGRFRSEAIRGIDVEGHVAELSAWRRLRECLEAAMIRCRPHLAGESAD